MGLSQYEDVTCMAIAFIKIRRYCESKYDKRLYIEMEPSSI